MKRRYDDRFLLLFGFIHIIHTKNINDIKIYKKSISINILFIQIFSIITDFNNKMYKQIEYMILTNTINVDVSLHFKIT